MKRTTVREISKGNADYIGKEVTVCGWIRKSRNFKTFGFVELNDGTFFKSIQVVVDKDIFPEVLAFNIGSSIEVQGKIVETTNAQQKFELHATKIMLLGDSDLDYPIQPKKHSMEYLRTYAHLRPRTNTFMAVFRVRSLVAYAIHKFFQEQGFVYVHTPLITGSDCEGAGEMFRVTTLDMDNIPTDEMGKADYSKDFFGNPNSLHELGVKL